MVVAVSAGGSILVGYPLTRRFYHCRLSSGDDHYAGGAGVGSGILTTGATLLSPLLKVNEEWGG